MCVVIANTVVALRLMVQSMPGSMARCRSNSDGNRPKRGTCVRPLRAIAGKPANRSAHYTSFFRRHYCIGCPSVLLELVMQRLQADAENLGRPGLIVRSRLQGFEDELSFGLFNGCTHTQMDGVGSVHRGASTLPETGRQMLGFDQTAFANKDRALQGIPQLPNIARPGVALEQIQYCLAAI